jgi:hypothetical protein
MQKRRVLTTICMAACLGLMALPVSAQSFDVGGGYAYRSFRAPAYGGTEPTTPMNGWFATVDYNFNRFIGVVTDFDMTRTNVPQDPTWPGDNTFSTVMVGPQLYPVGRHRITPFAHFEVGLAHFSNNVSNLSGFSSCGTAGSDVGPCTVTDGSFAFDAGGGVDFSLTRAFAIRVGEFDWDQTRMFEPGNATGNHNQNNWKVKAGIIVRFGGK